MEVEARDAEVKLSQIVEEVLTFVTSDENPRSSAKDPHRALELYNAILDWKYSLPERLRFEEVVLPSFIVVQ